MNINRNLKSATDITNRNMKALAEWNVDTLNTQVDFISAKLDYIDESIGRKIDELTGNQQSLQERLHQLKPRVELMSKEMHGFAEAASFDVVSRVSARRALEDFVQSSSPDVQDFAHSVVIVEKAVALHAKLKTAGSRSHVSRMDLSLQRAVEKMGQLLQLQTANLGLYMHHSKHSQRQVREWTSGRSSTAVVLVEIDRIWWRLRNALDTYIDIAADQVDSFNTALNALNDYRKCSTRLSDVTAAYDATLSVSEKAHAELRRTWRGSINLLGELAATIVDGEAFATFNAEEGCNSTLSKETLQQVKLAVGGMRILLHRHKVAGMKMPEIVPLVGVVKRIQDSYTQSENDCSTVSSLGGQPPTEDNNGSADSLVNELASLDKRQQKLVKEFELRKQEFDTRRKNIEQQLISFLPQKGNVS